MNTLIPLRILRRPLVRLGDMVFARLALLVLGFVRIDGTEIFDDFDSLRSRARSIRLDMVWIRVIFSYAISVRSYRYLH